MSKRSFVGVWSYTVILTYLSLLSGVLGIILALGFGRPYLAVFCLLVSGLCDAFDGRVARSKKDRTQLEKGFGIQIDSLTDLVSFGVCPAAIGIRLVLTSEIFDANAAFKVIALVIMALFVLCGMIRLAYFNVTEEELQQEGEHRTAYLGVPITASCLFFPTVLLIVYLTGIQGAVFYTAATLVLGFLFIAPVSVPKPGLRGILALAGIGALELLVLIIFMILK